MKQKYLFLLFLGLVLFVVISNRIIFSFLSSEKTKTSLPAAKITTTSPSKQSFVRKKKRYPLIPEDPEKYGIITTSKDNQPRGQLQWDVFMDRAIVKTKVIEDPGAQKALKEMKKSPEDFQSRMREVDERIDRFRKRLETNPNDQKAQGRIQTLYLLKSLGKILENKVTQP